ncbi:DUF1761 domain-containing protein, partial [bacterium]|nr:DUF1761 domain-containing protein [bacterium]
MIYFHCLLDKKLDPIDFILSINVLQTTRCSDNKLLEANYLRKPKSRMKPNVKYPSPKKKDTSAYYRSMPPRDTEKSSLMMTFFVFIGSLIFSYGVYIILYCLFAQSSVQGVFHGILLSLTGAILSYLSSHDRFVARKQ